MKKYIILLGFALFVGATAMAQWTTTGTTIHPTTLTNKVGINTTAAEAPFHLQMTAPGLSALQRMVNTGGAAAGITFDKANTGPTAAGASDFMGSFLGRLYDGTAYRPAAAIRFQADGAIGSNSVYGKLIFQTREGATLLTRMTVKPNGYVGIGTENPQSLLAVNGKVSAKEVEVTLSGWSDFVFASDYTLRPLSEVESFINTNKHLPDVPSEAEVLENGVNVGEMSATLLQKIEELTLYIIDLNKRIEELEK
jgi:hypothetical protein